MAKRKYNKYLIEGCYDTGVVTLYGITTRGDQREIDSAMIPEPDYGEDFPLESYMEECAERLARLHGIDEFDVEML